MAKVVHLFQVEHSWRKGYAVTCCNARLPVRQTVKKISDLNGRSLCKNCQRYANATLPAPVSFSEQENYPAVKAAHETKLAREAARKLLANPGKAEISRLRNTAGVRLLSDAKHLHEEHNKVGKREFGAVWAQFSVVVIDQVYEVASEILVGGARLRLTSKAEFGDIKHSISTCGQQ